MMKIIKRFFVFSFFIILGLISINPIFAKKDEVNENDSSRVSLSTGFELLADSVENNDKPASSNLEKLYESNIPDQWYDPEQNYGCNVEDDINLTPYMYMDFIDSERTTNYFTDENPIVLNIPYGETKDFYLEIAHLNWTSYNAPMELYSISGEGFDFFQLEVTQYYTDDGNSFETFDFFNSSSGETSFSTSSDTPRKMSCSRNSDTGLLEPIVNNNYYMPKFSFTGNNVGYGKLNFTLNAYASGGPEAVSYEVLICVSEHDTVPTDYSILTIKDYYFEYNDASANYRYMPLIFDADDYKDTPIPVNVHEDYPIVIDGYTISYSNLEYSYSFLSPSNDLEINGNSITFTKPGIYDIYYSVYMSIDFDSGAHTKLFSQKFKVLAYSEEIVDFEEGIFDSDGGILYLQQQDIQSIYVKDIDNPGLEVTYKIDGVETGYILENYYPGEYALTIEISEPDYNISIYRNLTLIIKNDDIYEKISLECGDTKDLTIGSFDFDNPTKIEITNYNYINKLAMVKINVVSGDANVSISDGFLNIAYATYGKNTIEFIVYYENKTVKSYFTINVLNEFVFCVNVDHVNMATNSTTSVSIGYLANSQFHNLPVEEYRYTIPSNSDLLEISMDGSVINLNSFENTGTTTIAVGIIHIPSDNTVVSIVSFNVTVGEEAEVVNATVDIMEGSLIKVLLSNKTKTVTLTLDPIINNYNYNFTWMSLNTKVVTVMKTSETTALVTGLGVGTTEVIAISQNDDGSTVTARTTITVFNESPSISIDFNKADETTTAFTIYDLINISLNNNHFIFSSDIGLKWYIDNVEVQSALSNSSESITVGSKTNNFYYKFTEGIHTIKVELIDNTYDLSLFATKEISISSVENQDRELSFKDDELYLALSGDMYLLHAYLDNVENTDYTYSWSIDDTKVVSIYMSENNTVLLKPESVGETILNVFTNIGKYEDKIIRAQITIKVEEVTTIELSTVNSFNRPGDNVEIIVLLNGKDNFSNINPKIDIKNSANQSVEFEYNNGKIIINNAQKAKLSINASINELSNSISVNVTNFDITQIMLQLLPYLIISLVIVLGGFIIFRVRSNPFVNSLKSIEKIRDRVEEAIKSTKQIKDIKHAKKEYKTILRKCIKLKNQLAYYTDEGIDEFKHTVNKIESVIKIFEVLINSSDDKIKKTSKVLANIKRMHINVIHSMIKEVIDARKKYQNIININNSKTEVTSNGKKKKRKLTSDEIDDYLIQNGITVYPEDVDEDDW